MFSAPRDREVSALISNIEAVLLPEALVLYGSSQAALHRGEWDLAVISERFQGLGPLERLELLHHAAGDSSAELRAFTPSEFLAMDRTVLQDILRTGLPVHDDGVFRRARQLVQGRAA